MDWQWLGEAAQSTYQHVMERAAGTSEAWSTSESPPAEFFPPLPPSPTNLSFSIAEPSSLIRSGLEMALALTPTGGLDTHTSQ